jgi:hypothetical protein
MARFATPSKSKAAIWRSIAWWISRSGVNAIGAGGSAKPQAGGAGTSIPSCFRRLIHRQERHRVLDEEPLVDHAGHFRHLGIGGDLVRAGGLALEADKTDAFSLEHAGLDER